MEKITDHTTSRCRGRYRGKAEEIGERREKGGGVGRVGEGGGRKGASEHVGGERV